MNEVLRKLKCEFDVIKEKGYVRGIYNSSSAIGRTFEKELGLLMNKNSIPDYNGVEIKTRRTYSKSMITLFSAVSNGEEHLEIKRLKDTYGYPYYRDRKYKCLYVEIYANKLTFGGRYYQYKLDVDKVNKRLYLCVYNVYGDLIERKVYWSFDYLRQKLEAKLNYLALVHAWPKSIDNWNYFKYYKIDFYKLKDFNCFLFLLENDKIKLSLKIDIYLDSANYGKMYDHGCSFSISEDDLNKLFYKYIIDVDKHI